MNKPVVIIHANVSLRAIATGFQDVRDVAVDAATNHGHRQPTGVVLTATRQHLRSNNVDGQLVRWHKVCRRLGHNVSTAAV